MFKPVKCVIAVWALVSVFGVAAHAAVITGNWCNIANIADPPAGYLESGNWSDLTEPNGYSESDTATGGTGDLIWDDGSSAPAAVTVSWVGEDLDTNDQADRPTSPSTTGADIDDGHDQLYAGFLAELQGNTPISVDLSGMSSAMSAVPGATHYNVYFYIDGDEESNPADWEMTDGTTTFYGRDDFTFVDVHTTAGSLADYSQVTNTTGTHQSGNYVMFGPYTGDSVAWTLQTVNSTDIGIPGFEIDVVPEPTTAALLGMFGLGLLLRRRR